jgi:hypothetical protein
MQRGLGLIVSADVMVIAAPMQTRGQQADDLAALNKRHFARGHIKSRVTKTC